MKKIILLLLGLSAALSSASGQMTEERNVGRFTRVKVSMGIDVRIVRAAEHSIVVEADNEQLISRTETYIDKGVLQVKYSMKINDNNFNGNHTVYVYAPDIDQIECTLGAEVEAEGLRGEHITLIANTGATISGEFNYRTVDVAAKLGSDIKLEGRANVCIAAASGGSDVDLKRLKCREVTATAKSGADLDVWASDRLDARATGGSTITYWGDPKVCNLNSGTSSDILKAKSNDNTSR